MIVLLAVAGILVTLLTGVAMMLLMPGGTVGAGEAGAFGQEAPDHGSSTRSPRDPGR